MNIVRIINTICLIVGIAVLVFAGLITAGLIPQVPVQKTPVLFILGGIIVIWSAISLKKFR